MSRRCCTGAVFPLVLPCKCCGVSVKYGEPWSVFGGASGSSVPNVAICPVCWPHLKPFVFSALGSGLPFEIPVPCACRGGLGSPQCAPRAAV
jgi:hypothetical protein